MLFDEPSDDSQGNGEVSFVVGFGLGCPLVDLCCFAVTISLLDAAYSLEYALKKF